MKILFFLSHIQKSMQWVWLAEGFKNSGITQTYIIIGERADSNKSLFVDDLEKMDIPVYYLPTTSKLGVLKNISKSVKIIRQFKPDVIHTSLPYGNFVGQIAAVRAGVKNRVTTCENASWAKDFNNKMQNFIDILAYKFSKKIIVTSAAAEEYIREHFSKYSSKLINITHAVKETDYENIANEKIDKIKNDLQIKPTDFIVGVIARYEYWKGHEFINKAAAILKKNNHNKDIKIFIFGSKGSYYETAIKQIKELGVEDVVLYKGFYPDSIGLFKVFDIHLHVPINKYVETAGINIIEGMIAQIPQILTKSGYAFQSAKHLHNAYVVDYENAQAIADAIVYLKNNKDIREQIATNAKTDAINIFGIKVKIDKHLQLYNTIIKA